MKVYKTDEIRNITLIGNAGSGKTTLAEAMLLEGGVINRRGDVGNKNTVSDYHLIEQEYGNSVSSSLMYAEVNGKKINILDGSPRDARRTQDRFAALLLGVGEGATIAGEDALSEDVEDGD